MYAVRNSREYPRGDAKGYTLFDASLMRPVVIKSGQAAQFMGLGNVTSVSTTYQMLVSDGLILAGTTGSYTVTLPAIANVPKGTVVYVKKTGASGTLTVDGSGAETIDGAATVTTSTQNDLVALVMNGSEWSRINLAGTAGVSKLTVTTQTTTASVASTDDLTVDTGTADHTLTLPAVSGLTGIVLRFKKTGVSGVVTVDGSGSETIDGVLTFSLTRQYETATIACNGTTWFRLDSAPALLVQSVTDTDTVLPNSQLVLLTGTNTYNLALPLPAAVPNRIIRFKKTGASGVATLTTPGAETIDGAASLAITAQYRSVELFSDGTNWHMIVDSTPTAG